MSKELKVFAAVEYAGNWCVKSTGKRVIRVVQTIRHSLRDAVIDADAWSLLDESVNYYVVGWRTLLEYGRSDTAIDVTDAEDYGYLSICDEEIAERIADILTAAGYSDAEIEEHIQSVLPD